MNSTFRERLKKVPLLVLAARLIRIIFDPQARSIWKLKTFNPQMLFQPSDATFADRYPDFFRFVRDQLIGSDRPRILSYGCSTGEEVFSLAKYLPEAEIKGIDINPRNIAICHKKLAQTPNPLISFAQASTPVAEQSAHYDAIFCMAVLRHGELRANRPARCDHLLRFPDFEAIIDGLARCLKPGGYLALWHIHFRFSDCLVANAFEPVFQGINDDPLDTPAYDRNNQLITDPPELDAIFRKKPHD